MAFPLCGLLLQHDSVIRHLYSCELSLGTFPKLSIETIEAEGYPQLTSFVPFLQTWSNSSPGTFTFISGVLPPAVSALFGFFLPIVMRWLSQYQGALTHSRLDRAVVARYFAFLVISQLVVFTLIGVIFSMFYLSAILPPADILFRLREGNYNSDWPAPEHSRDLG